MRLPNLTGEFRVGSDPELRFTPSGKAVCSVSLIATESKKVEGGGWEDGDSTPWITATFWDQQAEGVAETITKGERVLVNGLLFVREYETRDGNKGQSIELKWATIGSIPGGKPKAQRSSSYSDDPWTTPSPTPGGRPTQNVPADPWGTPQSDEPPF